MATTVDLNCDMGESFGAYKIGLDEEVAKYISSANVACGFHASDPVVMDKTVKILKENNVNLGAHPGYPDLMGFGRRNMNVSPADAKAYVMYQIGALSAFAKANGLKIQHVKPHGALYNTAGIEEVMLTAFTIWSRGRGRILTTILPENTPAGSQSIFVRYIGTFLCSSM